MYKLSKFPENNYTVKLRSIVLPSGFDEADLSTFTGLYLVMDFYEMNLDFVLTNMEGLLTERQASVLSFNLLIAIKFLHSVDIMHRDLKPANIMVTDQMEVKICDFGLARGINQIEVPKERKRKRSFSCFTRDYRPPEVILGSKAYDERADIWSMGCVISEIFQATVSDTEGREAMFIGDSCYPISPMAEKDQNIQKKPAQVSQDDLLFKVIQSVGKDQVDWSFVDCKFSKDYMKQVMASVVDESGMPLQVLKASLSQSLSNFLDHFL